MYGCRCPRVGSWGLSLIESGDCTLFIVPGGPYLTEDRMTPSPVVFSPFPGGVSSGYTLPSSILPFAECSALSCEF